MNEDESQRRKMYDFWNLDLSNGVDVGDIYQNARDQEMSASERSMK